MRITLSTQELRSSSAAVAWSASESEVANTLKAVASTATSQVYQIEFISFHFVFRFRSIPEKGFRE